MAPFHLLELLILSPSMTSWEDVGEWYGNLVGKEGHYYHQHVIIPKLLSLLSLRTGDHLVDLGCGQGILARHLPKGILYQGIDASPSLIQQAPKGKGREYLVADVCRPLPFPKSIFTHAVFLLSLQNMEKPELALQETAKILQPGATLVLVLNHPCFRIPRQSSWGIDEQTKLQYRRIQRYLSPMQIPISIRGQTTYSFHHSLSDFSSFLLSAGYTILQLEEWVSDKISVGSAAKMENTARKEFPLFLTIKCRFAHT